MSGNVNAVVVGQSGQGTILVSKVLATAYHRSGLAVVATEYPAITHRYAITYAHVRSGRGVFSPRIRPREASIVLGLEAFECLRASLLFANPDTVVVSNDSFIRTDGEPNHLLTEPIAVETIGDIVAALAGRGITRVVPLAATRLAFEVAGSRAGTNMVLLGAAFASGRLQLEQAALEEAIIDLAPRDTGERNCQGFLAGIAAYRAAIGEGR